MRSFAHFSARGKQMQAAEHGSSRASATARTNPTDPIYPTLRSSSFRFVYYQIISLLLDTYGLYVYTFQKWPKAAVLTLYLCMVVHLG